MCTYLILAQVGGVPRVVELDPMRNSHARPTNMTTNGVEFDTARRAVPFVCARVCGLQISSVRGAMQLHVFCTQVSARQVDAMERHLL